MSSHSKLCNSFVNLIAQMPMEFRDEAKVLLAKLLEYQVTKTKQDSPPRFKLEGAVLSAAEILAIIKEGTGYTRWVLDQNTDEAHNPEELRKKFNCDFDFSGSEMRTYEFSRPYKSRDEVFMFRILPFPGFVYVIWSTDRAADVLCRSEKITGLMSVLIRNEDLQKTIDRFVN